MSNNDFILNIIAALNKQLSNAHLKNDLKGMNNTLFVKVIAKLTTALSKKQLANSLKQINNLYVQVGTKFKTDNSSKKKIMSEIEQLQKKLSELQIKVNIDKAASANTVKSVVSTAKLAQQYADKTSITLDVEIRKEKAVNDILYIGQKYSKLFSNISVSQKYENLLNSAYSISDKTQLQKVRMQIAAFTSELKANGLAAQSTGDKWKKLIDRSKELFSAATVVRMIFIQVKQAVSTTIDLDKTYTDLVKVNDELNRNDYADYLSNINQKAKELAATQKALIEGATEFSKSGYDLSTSDALTEKSMILSNVGDMSASDSAKAIISGVQAYDLIDGYDDVIDKAGALIDKYNEIGNTASITTGEIAQGVQAVGSVFADANTSVDEFIALLAAGNRQYQDADALALGLRTAALRIRGCSAELETMGEETDNVYTSASKLAEKIAGLTNVNGSGGVKILKDDEETFRSIYDIFLDISKVYQDMSDTDASALLELIAGKNRASAISATLNNMTEAEEILQNSINAAGSAQKEYDAYMESTEAHIQKFQAALVETYSTFMNGDMISHATDIGTVVLDLVNSTDLLKHSILAILALNVGKGITNIGVAIAATSKQMNTLGSALQQIKNLPTDKVLRNESLHELGKETLSLTEKNLKLLLSQNKLEDSDKIRILRAQDLSKEEAKAKLEKMGLLTVTNQQTTANVAEAAATGTLKNAMLSLKASAIGTGNALKAAFLSNPIGIALTAITTAISVGTTLISKHNQKLEETRQANLDAAATASENADRLKDLYTEYTRLASIQNRTASEEESFKTAVENITVALGNKAKALEGLTAGTDEYADALANATKEELQNQAVDATVGRKSTEEALRETVFNRWSGSKVAIDSEALSEDAKRAADIVSGTLKDYKTHNNTWDFQFSGDMSEVFEYYNALIKAKKELVLAGQDDETLLDTKVYSDLNDVINSMSESMDAYIKQRYEEEKLVYMSQNRIPATTEEYRNMEKALTDTAGASGALQDKFKEMLMSDFSDLAADIQNAGGAVGDATDFSTQLTASQEALDKFQSSVKSAYDAYSTLLSGNYSSSDLLDSIQEINQAATDMGGSINWDSLDILPDSLELLGNVIDHVSEKYAESVLSGAGIDIDSKFGQMLANNIIQAQKAGTQLEVLNDQIDSLQGAYNSLTDIVEAYNETGYITFDQLQTLLEMEPQYLSCLMDENGQLQLNEAAVTSLANQRLNDAEAQAVQQAITELGQLALQDEKTAVEENAQSFSIAVNDLAGYNAELANTIAEATVGASAIRDLNAAINGAESNGATDDQINTVLDNLETKLKLIGDARGKINNNGLGNIIGKSGKSAAKETEKEVDIMAELNAEMDKLQSAYKSLCDIRDTYNEYGKITVDQYQELTDMGFNFLAELVDENGQLGVNASAFEHLAKAKLEEMQIQMARNATDTINGLKTEAEAVEYLTYANEHLRDAALGAAEAQLQAAVAAAKMKGEQQGAAAEQIYQGYQASKQLAGKVDFFFNPDEKEEKEDKTDKLLEAYNKEKALLEHMHAMGQISNAEFYEKLLALAKRYFEGDEEHRDQLWDAEESYHDYLESIKETYNWIEVFLNNLAKKTNALIDKAGKFISWAKKNAMINRAVKATDKQIQGQTNAYAYYAEKARKVGLNNAYINKIQNGTLTVEDMQNEALSDKIEKYQEWYDKMVECEDAIDQLYNQERDLIKQKLDNVLDYYSNLDSYLSSIVSKLESTISLMDGMGKRSSLTDLLEQFAAVNDQVLNFQSQTTIKNEDDKNYFDSSQKVADAKNKDKTELISSLSLEKEQVESGVQNTGTYKKLLKSIEKAQLAYDKQYEKLWNIDSDNDPDGKKWEKEQKKLEQLGNKLDSLINKRDDLKNNATANNITEYSKIYDSYMKLLNKQESLQEKGKDLSLKELDKMEALFNQMIEMGGQRSDAVKELENQINNINGITPDIQEADRIRKELKDIDDGVKNSATYQNLEKDIDSVQAKIDKFWDTHDSATNAQQKQLDKWENQLNAYYEKQKQLEENATAATVGEYSKIYDAWRKLQDKLDAGKVLSATEWKNYNKYNDQLKQFADERTSIIKSLNDELEKALNPGDKIAVINREYEEAAEGIYNSYQNQIDNIDKKLKASKEYQNLLAKKQNLENIRDTKGLTAAQEKTLKKYTEELAALEKGGTGDNISNYIKTWENWYKLQQKMDSGKKLSTTEASNYDKWKAQLDAWNNDKQTQISDLISLMEDDLEKLRETNAENIAEAEQEINSYYSKVYELAKQIAEYNINALEEQLAYLDAYISYYKELVSLYDSFSGDKLSKLLSDLDESAMNDQIKVYEKYLDTLSTKYDATLSEINEYKQLIDAIDTNNFQGSMDLFQKAMDSYTASGNTAMAEKLKSVLDLLNERAVDADNWEEYADLWLNEWEQALADAKSELISTAGSIQDVNDALREISFANITDAISELEKADGILSSIENLIQDEWLFEPDGNLSEYGRAKAALLVSQLEDAQAKANEYLNLYDEIQKKEDTYASDKAYKEDLNSALQSYYDSLGSAANLENSIMDLMKKNAEAEINSLKDIINARKKALQAKKEYYDYDKSIKNSQKEIDSLKAQIDALESLSDATDAATKAKLAQLKAELAEKEDALQETKDDHTYNLQIDALDDFADSLTDALDNSSKSVEEILKEQTEIISSAKDLYQTSSDSVNETLDRLTAFYSSIGASIDGNDLKPDNTVITGGADVPSISLNPNGSIIKQQEAIDGLRTEVNNRLDKNISAVEKVSETISNNSSEIRDTLRNGELTRVSDAQMLQIFSEKTLSFLQANVPQIAFDVNRTIPDAITGHNVQQPTINVHYDNMINVEGNVDKNVLNEFSNNADALCNSVVNKLIKGLQHNGVNIPHRSTLPTVR